MPDFDDTRRQGEEARRAAAAARAAEREAALARGARAPDAVSASPRRTLILVAATALAGLGLVVGFFSRLAAFLFFVPALAMAGLAWRAPGVDRPRRASLNSDPVRRAYEDARAAIEGSRRMEEDRRMELLAALQGGLEQVEASEAHRTELERGLAEVPPSAPESGRLRKALDDLESRRSDFLEACGRLRRTAIALDLAGGDRGALDDLSAAADHFRAEAAAEEELREALRIARSPTAGA